LAFFAFAASTTAFKCNLSFGKTIFKRFFIGINGADGFAHLLDFALRFAKRNAIGGLAQSHNSLTLFFD